MRPCPKRFLKAGRVTVLGTLFSPVTLEAAAGIILQWVQAESGPRYVCVSGVHGVMEGYADSHFQQVLNAADLNVPDGMPIARIAQWSGVGPVGRVFGPDLMLEVCARSVAIGVSHFFYGGKSGVAETLAAKMSARFPGLNVVGTFCPPFRPLSDEEEAGIAAFIADRRADIVWVGLSTPKQEYWMSRMTQRLQRGVMIGVGAAFDYNTDTLRRAPKWMQDASLEWLYRLVQEPRRLYRRYLFNNPKFLFLIAGQALGIIRESTKR